MKLFNTSLVCLASVCWLSLLRETDARYLTGAISNNDGNTGQPDPMVAAGTKVEFVGAAPKFRYFRDKDSSDFVMVDFKQISELDNTDNQERSLSGWASKNFEWTSDTFTNDDGVEVVAVMLSLTNVTLEECGGNSNQSASFDVLCYMPQGNTTISGVEVPAGGFKFALNISQWDFCGEKNTLQFWFQLKGSNAEPDASSNSVAFQEGKVVFEDNVIIDGVEKDVQDLDISGTDVRITYPHFDNQLWYDPTVTGEDDEDDGNGALSLTTASSAIPLAATCLAGILLSAF
eukprot:gb/GECG01010329.1/.p1 GENE.gb/GECG01010329.1/~~gb/GECG01010329.1/.p1  ORF type:complete len:289 (+),score=41.03 gb/GECG01010329.1/:1-867(+)